MAVDREEFHVKEFYSFDCGIEPDTLTRQPNGSWSCSASVDLDITLPDGRRIQGQRYITVPYLQQTRRRDSAHSG